MGQFLDNLYIFIYSFLNVVCFLNCTILHKLLNLFTWMTLWSWKLLHRIESSKHGPHSAPEKIDMFSGHWRNSACLFLIIFTGKIHYHLTGLQLNTNTVKLFIKNEWNNATTFAWQLFYNALGQHMHSDQNKNINNQNRERYFPNYFLWFPLI